MAKILIVEDDRKIADYVSTVLLAAGHPCVCANSAAEARHFLEVGTDFALAILDYHLGDEVETGHGFLAALRTFPQYRDLPVIVCTADSRQEVVRNFLPLRIVGFLRKPFRPDRLLTDVTRVLGAAHDQTRAPWRHQRAS